MPIPAPDKMIQPVLQHMADTEQHRRKNIIEMLKSHFSLTENERRVLSESGLMEKFLVSKGLIERAERWHYRITSRGLEILNQGSEEDFALEGDNQGTEESFDDNYQQIQEEELAAELLQKIKNNTPAFFEKLVVNLLVNMGYGGSWEDAGEVTGGPGDGGIDGIINQDKLGLDVVGIQAKLRTTGNNVGLSVINEFVGALRLNGLGKGVIITTTGFSSNARASAEGSDNPKIVLIDGEQLAQLMIDHDVGVSVEKTYEIKRVDSDYFAENTEDP